MGVSDGDGVPVGTSVLVDIDPGVIVRAKALSVKNRVAVGRFFGFCVGVSGMTIIVKPGRLAGDGVKVFIASMVEVLDVIVGLGVGLRIDARMFFACSFCI